MPVRERDRRGAPYGPTRDRRPIPDRGAARPDRQERTDVALAVEAPLHDLGHSVVGTGAAERPDLAIVDIRLQDRTGGAVAKEMRERCSARSILLTRHFRTATLRRLREARPLDIVTMPFHQERLRLAVLTASLRLDDARGGAPQSCANPCPIPCAGVRLHHLRFLSTGAEHGRA